MLCHVPPRCCVPLYGRAVPLTAPSFLQPELVVMPPADLDVDALVQFIATSDERRAVIRQYFSVLDTRTSFLALEAGAALFHSLRTVACKFDPRSPVDRKANFQERVFTALSDGPEANWRLLQGEVLRFRAWAEGACWCCVVVVRAVVAPAGHTLWMCIALTISYSTPCSICATS